MSRTKRILIVGVGGLGHPLAWILARSGLCEVTLADDDVVEEANLHRQILFEAADVGLPKTEAARKALAVACPGTKVAVHDGRILPANAIELVSSFDGVVEGSDNFATKFLVADACHLAKVPVVHGAAVRWHGTALAVGALGRPCYRCVFEDIPMGAQDNCDTAGVMGPVVGIVGAIQADLAIAGLEQRDVAGTLVTYDGKAEVLRRRQVMARGDCELCGERATIRIIDAARYGAGG